METGTDVVGVVGEASDIVRPSVTRSHGVSPLFQLGYSRLTGSRLD